jgi:putative transposase
MIVDPGESDLSMLMRQFKLSFSSQYRKRTGAGKGRVWQYRFWDHQIRDEGDLTRHLDYIPYNPVTYGLTMNPFAWKFSSIHGFRKQGFNEGDWGVIEKPECDGEYGE